MKQIGITGNFEPAFFPEWSEQLKDLNIIITRRLSDEMIEKLVNNKDKCILHLTCSGLGETIYEPGVPNFLWTYSQFNKLLESGFPLIQCVLRVNTVIPDEKKYIKYIQEVFELFKTYKIRCRISLLNQHSHIIREIPRKLPLDTFKIPQSIINKVIEFLSSWKNDYQFEVCAESGFTQDWINHNGCASIKDIEILGMNPDDFDLSLNGEHPECRCIKRVGLLEIKPHRCTHKCIHCYWNL